MIVFRSFALLLPLALAGCGAASVTQSPTGRDWKDTDSTGIPVTKGAKECTYEAKQQASLSTGLAKQAELQLDLYDTCMRQRGY
jgi:hypothetical protein